MSTPTPAEYVNHWFCNRCVITIETRYNTWGKLNIAVCPVCKHELQPVDLQKCGLTVDRQFDWNRPKTAEEALQLCDTEVMQEDELVSMLKNGGLILQPPSTDKHLTWDELVDKTTKAHHLIQIASEEESLDKVLDVLNTL